MDRQGAAPSERTASTPKTHANHDQGFRQEAVNPLLSSGRPLKRVAAELDVSANSLRTKSLHLSHDAKKPVSFKIEVDFLEHGAWKTYATIKVPAKGYVPHVFPGGFSAHWVRATASAKCKATAQLHYT